MDPIATYKRTGRVITLSWDIPSTGLLEAKENMAKANLLISMLYPVFETPANNVPGSSTVIKSGPLFRIKMGNLIIKPGVTQVAGPAKLSGLPGIIEGFQYTPKLDEGVFAPASKITPNAETNALFDIAGLENETLFGKTTTYKNEYDGALYPQTLTANISFVVLHDTPLGWELDGDGNPKMRNTQGEGSRFPYGGDNSTLDSAMMGQTLQGAGGKVRKDDWEAHLNLEKDIIARRASIRVTQMLKPARDMGRFVGGNTSGWTGW
jgi:hypothetical protein